MWWKIWARSCDACMKLLPQNWQLWGFTPVCVLTWRFSVSFAANLARHWNQTYRKMVLQVPHTVCDSFVERSILLHIKIQKSAEVSVSMHNMQESWHRIILSTGCNFLSAHLSYYHRTLSWLSTCGRVATGSDKHWTWGWEELRAGLDVWEKKIWVCCQKRKSF